MPFIVLNAGIAAPLAYLGAFIIALFLGYVLAQFSRHLSSTGSYYTFVSRSLGGRWGFLVAWVYLLFYPVVIAQVGLVHGLHPAVDAQGRVQHHLSVVVVHDLPDPVRRPGPAGAGSSCR